MHFTLIFLFLFGLMSECSAFVLQVERAEMLQASRLIAIGTILDKKTRWNEERKFIMTDYTFSVDRVLYGETENPIVLSFAGGQIGEEATWIDDVPTFEIGETALLLVVSTEKNVMSSLAGSFQGKFTVGSPVIDKSGRSIRPVIDGYGTALQDKTGNSLDFDDFIEEILREIPIAKSKPPRVVSTELPPHLKKYVIPKENLPVKIYNPDKKCAILASGSREERRRYQFTGHHANPKPLPRVFEPLPPSNTFWPYDRWAMDHWNQYVDIFRVLQATTNEWGGFRNGCNEFVGFIDTKTVLEQTGVLLPAWVGVTISNRLGPNQTEEDILLNNEVWWGDDWSIAYDKEVPTLYKVATILNVVVHELGHALGLDHDFNRFAKMNYLTNLLPPHNRYHFGISIFSDDANGARELYKDKTLYPNAIQQITDGSVRLFFHTRGSFAEDSQLRNIQGGYEIRNFTLENMGTTEISTPQVEWYLTQEVFKPNTPMILLETTVHSALSAGTSRLEPGPLALHFPSYMIEPGIYYLAACALVPGDKVPGNDCSWLPLQRLPIVVIPVPEPEPP